MNEWIYGVVVKQLFANTDDRGSLTELFRMDSLDVVPQMGYVSWTKPGVGRGPHEHEFQMDIFAFVGPGHFRIWLWDNREHSETYGKRVVMDGGSGEPILVIVPTCVVHGYKNISDMCGMVLNFPNRLYKGKDKQFPVDEIRHEDDKDGRFVMEE